MLHPIPKPSNLVWSSEPLLGFKVANHLDGGSSHASCLPASVGTAELAAATLPEINAKIAFQSWVDAREGARTLALTPRSSRSVPTVPG